MGRVRAIASTIDLHHLKLTKDQTKTNRRSVQIMTQVKISGDLISNSYYSYTGFLTFVLKDRGGQIPLFERLTLGFSFKNFSQMTVYQFGNRNFLFRFCVQQNFTTKQLQREKITVWMFLKLHEYLQIVLKSVIK